MPDTPCTYGAASDDVAGTDLGTAGGVADHVRERPEQITEIAVRVGAIVHAGPQAEPRGGVAGQRRI